MINLPSSWQSGPISDKELKPSHDRPIHAIAVKNDIAVTASADHSLRVWDLSKGSHSRHLFNKNFGHKEWVTCCTFLNDQRILSGGMDGVLCLWDRKAVRCENLSEHSSSISAVMVDSHDIAVSASYDKTLVVWDLHRLIRLLSMTASSPITTFAWNNSLVVSGGRDGKVFFWDINTGKYFHVAQDHSSAVNKISFYADGGSFNVVGCCATDGKVSIYDMRDQNAVFSQQVHRGSVNFVDFTMSSTLVSASADSSVKILDLFMGFTIRETLTASAGVLCGEIVENLFVSGCADGNLIVFDMDTSQTCFGFGADNVGGINCLCLNANKRKLVTGGESGIPLLLNF